MTNPVSPELTSKVLDYISSHEEEILEDLKALSRIPSVRGEAEPGFPFGRMPAAALETAADLYEKHGFICTGDYMDDNIGGKPLREVMYLRRK